MKYYLLLALIFLTACTAYTPDQYAQDYDFNYITDTYHIEVHFEELDSSFAQGDAILIEARQGEGNVLDAIPYYEEAIATASKEEQALLYETIASITGKKKYYYNAYKIWKELDNEFRAEIDWALFLGKDPELSFQSYELKDPYLALPRETEYLYIGQSSFILEENDILVSQVDRVTRDWLSSQLQDPHSENILTVFSEEYDVEDIGWHEGGRVAQYQEALNIEHKAVTGTIVKKFDNQWYAPNEEGIFMFEVPIDKIQYPTTRFLREDLALIIDTHGVNMIVMQAIEEEADTVIACCDHIGKIKAALYLNDKGINVICNTDRHLPEALSQTNMTLGSPPFKVEENKIVFGDQEVIININEKIVVQNGIEDYGLTYYATPYVYFTKLEEKTTIDLDLEIVTVTDYGQMYLVVDKARETNAQVMAVRVYDESDYTAVKEWLEESEEHRAILFHSEAYPYGYKILREFPDQTSFDDPKPLFS